MRIVAVAPRGPELRVRVETVAGESVARARAGHAARSARRRRQPRRPRREAGAREDGHAATTQGVMAPVALAGARRARGQRRRSSACSRRSRCEHAQRVERPARALPAARGGHGHRRRRRAARRRRVGRDDRATRGSSSAGAVWGVGVGASSSPRAQTCSR